MNPFVSGLHWRRVGYFSRNPGQWRLICHCHVALTVFDHITTMLATVTRKNDGRWEWTVHASPYAPPPWRVTEKSRQGVVTLFEEAVARCEAFLQETS